MKAGFLALLVLLAPAFGHAAEPHVQSSMLVGGTITVSPNGSVRGYTLYKQDELQPFVTQIVKRTVATWQFVPIEKNGKAVPAEAGMMLRIIADRVDEQHVAVRVAGAQFGCSAWLVQRLKLLPDVCPKSAYVTAENRKPPRYPVDALRAGVGGEVFLVLQVGLDGHVTQAAVRQVNLYAQVPLQAQYRKALADASLKAARKWQFQVPMVGPEAEKEHWIVQVPIRYTTIHTRTGTLLQTPQKPRSQWTAYIPGPVHDIPWADQGNGAAAGSADAIAGGGAFVRDTRFVLKTPLAGDSGKS